MEWTPQLTYVATSPLEMSEEAMREELERLRRHAPVQPVCSTCQRISELTKALAAAGELA